MGSFIANQNIQSSLERSLSQHGLNFLKSLILIGLYFEDSKDRLGPSRLASSLGFSRSRTSQEITSLNQAGFVVRTLSAQSGRSVNIRLTSAGEKKAQELIKIFSRIQQQIDRTLGESRAEELNADLIKMKDCFK